MMIRVSEKGQPLWTGAQLEKPQLHENDLSSTVNNICNLPLEMKRKIVSYLNYDDYANLRAVCKRFSQEFQGIEGIKQTLDNKACTGGYQRELKRLIQVPEMRSRLQEPSMLNIRVALQNMKVRNASNRSGDLIVSTDYLPRHYPQGDVYNIPRAMEICQKLLPQLAHRSTDSSIIVAPNTYHVCANSFIFLQNEMDDAAIVNTFAAFNTAYNAFDSEEKWVIAAIASAIKEAWLSKPPQGFLQEDIVDITQPYSDMLYTGDRVREAISGMKPLSFKKQ